MYKNRKILALIPARGGSKGLPYKNIKPLLGKPLIAWTIEQARKSKYIDRVIVSTDDAKIARISKRYNAEVPFIRPKELAGDDSPIFETVLHAMKYFERKNEPFDVLLLLECTSPMRYKSDIDNVIAKIVNHNKATGVIGMVEVTSEHPMWCNKLINGYLVKFVSKASSPTNMNRQLLEKAYLPNSIYATWWDDFKKYKSFHQPKTLPYFLKKEQSVDINDEVDFYIAECIIKRYLLKKE